MKKIGQALLIFVLLMGIAYFGPVFFDDHKKVETTPSTVQSQVKQPVSQKEKVLPAKGFAREIGQSKEAIEAKFGKPKECYELTDKQEWWQYEDHDQWFQVYFNHDKVGAILAIGDQKGLGTLMMGTNIAVLSAQIHLPTKLSFNYDSRHYEVDLNENELQMNPLLRFDNGSYAMLQMDHQGNLAGVMYVDVNELLANMPYELLKGHPVQNPEITQTDSLRPFIWKTLCKLHPANRYQEEPAMDDLATQLLSEFKEHPQDYIKKEEVYQNWEDIMQHNGSVSDVSFSSEVTNRLLKKVSLDDDYRMILFTTTHQLNWEVLNRYYRYRMMAKEDANFDQLNYGLATDGVNVLIMMSPMEE